jgi:hypothetical protein
LYLLAKYSDESVLFMSVIFVKIKEMYIKL